MLGDEFKNIDEVVLFDGFCNLCNTSVQFILSRERGNILKFASLQSELGIKIIESYKLKALPDSFIFFKQGQVYTQSDAALMVLGYLRFPWNWLVVFKIVPRFIRNSIYNWVATHRYKWFGRREACRVPTKEEKEKFLG